MRKGDLILTDCNVTGTDVGTPDKPKISLRLLCKKTSPRLVLHRAAVARTHGTECRTERESLEEGAVDELPVGLREVNLHQCLSSIVFTKKNKKPD